MRYTMAAGLLLLFGALGGASGNDGWPAERRVARRVLEQLAALVGSRPLGDAQQVSGPFLARVDEVKPRLARAAEVCPSQGEWRRLVGEVLGTGSPKALFARAAVARERLFTDEAFCLIAAAVEAQRASLRREGAHVEPSHLHGETLLVRRLCLPLCVKAPTGTSLARALSASQLFVMSLPSPVRCSPWAYLHRLRLIEIEALAALYCDGGLTAFEDMAPALSHLLADPRLPRSVRPSLVRSADWMASQYGRRVASSEPSEEVGDMTQRARVPMGDESFVASLMRRAAKGDDLFLKVRSSVRSIRPRPGPAARAYARHAGGDEPIDEWLESIDTVVRRARQAYWHLYLEASLPNPRPILCLHTVELASEILSFQRFLEGNGVTHVQWGPGFSQRELVVTGLISLVTLARTVREQVRGHQKGLGDAETALLEGGLSWLDTISLFAREHLGLWKRIDLLLVPFRPTSLILWARYAQCAGRDDEFLRLSGDAFEGLAVGVQGEKKEKRRVPSLHALRFLCPLRWRALAAAGNWVELEPEVTWVRRVSNAMVRRRGSSARLDTRFLWSLAVLYRAEQALAQGDDEATERLKAELAQVFAFTDLVTLRRPCRLLLRRERMGLRAP